MEPKSRKVTQDEVEVAEYSEALNIGVGLVLFTLGISCLGTPNPQRTAIICVLLVGPVLLYAANKFPKTIKDQRKIVKNDPRNGKEVAKLKELEKKHFTLYNFLTKNSMFLAGILFYALIILDTGVLDWLLHKPD